MLNDHFVAPFNERFAEGLIVRQCFYIDRQSESRAGGTGGACLKTETNVLVIPSCTSRISRSVSAWAADRNSQKKGGMPRLLRVKRIKLLYMTGFSLLVKLKPLVPFFESFSTIVVQLVCVAKKVFTGVRNRLIEFTIIIVVFPTDPRPILVDAAHSTGL